MRDCILFNFFPFDTPCPLAIYSRLYFLIETPHEHESWGETNQLILATNANPPELLKKRIHNIMKVQTQRPTRPVSSHYRSSLTLIDAENSTIYAEAANAAKDCSKSSMMSSMCSIPTETRMRSGETPELSCSSGVSCSWVVEAGWMTRVLAGRELALGLEKVREGITNHHRRWRG